MSKDIKMDNFSVTFHGAELIQDSKVELSCGRKYGLIGVNGSGKSSFLAVLGTTEMIFSYNVSTQLYLKYRKSLELTNSTCL